MERVKDFFRKYKLFSHKEEGTAREYNDELYKLKNFTDHPYWCVMKDLFIEETKSLNSQLLYCKDNDARNIVIGQLKELDRIVRITESKASKNYLEEMSDE